MQHRTVRRIALLAALLVASLVALTGLPAAAWAAGVDEALAFDMRVKAASTADGVSRYPAYQTVMFQAIDTDLAGAFSRCVTGTKDADTRSFALVADIDAQGHPRNIAVRPDTNVARCLTAAFVKFPFPKPPKIKGRNTLPILLSMSVAH